MAKKDFKNHPEMREDEVFIANIFCNDIGQYSNLDRGIAWNSIGWRTKRMGSVAYDPRGDIIPGSRPVFVQRAELQEAGIDPDNLLGM